MNISLFFKFQAITFTRAFALLLLPINNIYSQPCTTCPESCSPGCTWTISSSSSTNYDIATGEKLCITGGTYTGDIDFTGDGKVCVSGGNFNPGDIHSGMGDEGTIQINAGANATIPTTNYTGSRALIINNCGTITHTGNMTRGGSGTYKYYNNGTVDFGNYIYEFSNDCANVLCNDGMFKNVLDINYEGSIYNYDTMLINRDLLNTGSCDNFYSYGYTSVTGATDCSGSGSYFIYYGSNFETTDIAFSGSCLIDGVEDCGVIEISGSSTFTGSSGATGTVSICDESGVAPTRACTDADPCVDSYSGTSTWSVDITYCDCSALPIELLKFSGYRRNDEVYLEWFTASETNNDFFTIERSSDGQSFETVDIIRGAGNSNSILHYHVIDAEPIPGISYYRLKQTDYDGRYEYSDLVAVKFLRKLNFSVRPNPATDYLEVTFGKASKNIIFVMTPEYDASIKIYDSQGNLVYKKEFNGTFYKFNIDVSSFNQGMYFVSLTANNELYKTKFVKK